jgi:hypothetical protein
MEVTAAVVENRLSDYGLQPAKSISVKNLNSRVL